MSVVVLVAAPDRARATYVEAFARSGLHTHTVSDIDEALQACALARPDVLVAVDGPALDAVAACRRLKCADPRDRCGALLIGPAGDDARHHLGLTTGADACLPPGAPPDVVAAQALAIARGRESSRREENRLFSVLREGFAHYRAIYDQAGQLVDLRVLRINAAGARLTGAPPETQTGRSWREVWPGVADSVFDVYRRVDQSGETAHFDHDDRLTGLSYDVAVSRLEPGEFAVTFSDNTERKSAEAALRQANEELRRSGRHKDEFIAILSHELRNPLAPIRMALPLLGRDRLGEQGARAAGVIERQVNHLTRLLDDLLDVSRISRGKLDIRPQRTTLGSILKAALEAASPLVMTGRHDLRVHVPDEPIWIRADLARLTQVVTNLVNNSASCTPRGGRIEVEAGREAGRAFVRIRDNGIGIPPQSLPDLFEMFRQVKRADQPQGGLGIGLALSRRLIEMHGGTIQAHSAGVGRGAEFVVHLPLAERVVGTEIRPVAPRQDHELLKVLIVDDNEDLVEMLSAIVTDLGHEVRKALDGGSALDAARSYHPDLVLLDLGLPVLSGIEVARELRRRPETADVCLIAITGWGAPEDRARTRDAGFNHHLTKPVDPEQLIQVIAQCA